MWRSRKSRVWEAVPETACGSYTALPTLLSRVSSMRCVLFLFPNLRTWQSSHYLSFTVSLCIQAGLELIPGKLHASAPQPSTCCGVTGMQHYS